jgi:hypothetical protein
LFLHKQFEQREWGGDVGTGWPSAQPEALQDVACNSWSHRWPPGVNQGNCWCGYVCNALPIAGGCTNFCLR